MLTNMKDLLRMSKNLKCAVAHFNINNLEWTKYILEVAKKENTAVILGASESAVNYMGGYHTVYYMVYGLIQDLEMNVPVVLHLDHGSSFLSCKKAIDAGFTSVMIDVSHLPFEKNIQITKDVVCYAQKKNVSVEAELGVLGQESSYTDVGQAQYFVEKTKVDALAPSVGNSHGLYQKQVSLSLDRIKEISEKVDIPLVLHGGSGIPEDLILKSIEKGICKINYNTDLQISWYNSVKDYMKNSDTYDPRKIISSGEISMKEKIKEKLDLLNKKSEV